MDSNKMRLLSIILAASMPLAAHPQAIKDFVEHHTQPIQSISPDSLDFSDLEGIGRAIGDRRIVMLGEQDHGDAPTFQAKTRLIKYLHERKGFNVLVFESDFFSLTQGFEEAAPTATPDEVGRFLRQSIFPIWTYCDGCKDLFSNYLPNHAKELTVAGMDCQMVFGFAYRLLKHRLDSVLRGMDLPITHAADYASRWLPLVDSLRDTYWFKREKRGTVDSMVAWVNRAGEESRTRAGEDDFWVQLLYNLRDEAEEYEGLEKTDRKTGSAVRDNRMAQNLAWLARVKYPGAKLIVWAANAHVAKRDKEAVMGGIFTKDSVWNKETYVIGFTGFEGEGGRIGSKPYTIPPAPANSFEGWIAPELSYAFVDFGAFNAQFPGEGDGFRLRYWDYRSSRETWNRIFDGMFFIRRNVRCVIPKELKN
jgi:hypothetical protein